MSIKKEKSSILKHSRKIKIKTGDTVIVIAGKDKNKKGKVQKIDYKNNTCLVEGVNFVTKHKKPTQENPKGSVVKVNAPIHISNVMYYSNKLNKGIRLGYKLLESDEGKKPKKIRIGRHKGEVIEI